MLEVITGVGVFAVLCLATKSMRLYGVLALAILSMLYPLSALVLAVTVGTAYLIFRNRFT
jgi:hypothetical protein